MLRIDTSWIAGPSPARKAFAARAAVALAWAIAGAVPAAHAVDGVAEISHVCAEQTGCFSGDAAGYPVTIDGSAGRSYRLTSDLVVPDEFTNGITVDTPSITIDLNGFEIVRAGCEGATSNCTPAVGTGAGVSASVADRGVSVRNGSITGMGGIGVRVGQQGRVSGVRVRWNRGDGIVAGVGSVVSGNLAYYNGDEGIFALGGSTISDNVAYGNGGNGIEAGFGLVQRNTVASNGGYGLHLSAFAAYRENSIHNNALGTVDGGMNMGSNSCDGAFVCP